MRNRQEFKTTEIGKIPKEWEEVKLGEVVEINKESIDPTRAFPDKKFFYIDIDSVENGTGTVRDVKQILGKDAPSRARRIIHYNNVLMSTVRPYLKAFTIVPKNLNNQICSTGFAVLSCKEPIFPQFLLYTLFTKSVIEQCTRMMRGGQYPALNVNQVSNIKLPLPPLLEQQKIAEILSTADEAIQKVDEAIEKNERLKKGLMHELLTGKKRVKLVKESGASESQGIKWKGVKESEGQDSTDLGHTDFQTYKVTEIGSIPKEWEVVRLGEICEFFDHKRIPLKEQDRAKRKGNVPYYGAQGIIDWVDRYIFDGDYILLAEDGENLRSRKLPVAYKVSGKFWVNNHAHVLKIANKINDNYFLSVLNFINLSQFIVGSAQPKLNQADAKKIKLLIPSLPEQQKISEILSTVDKKLELLRERKERFERIKKGFMNDLLTGRKRVTF